MYFGFVFWTIFNGSRDFFSTSDPTTYSFESYKEDPDLMVLSPENFPIAVGIQGPDTLSYESYIDERIFKLTMVHALLHRITLDNGTVVEEWTYTDIETEICTPEHFNELSQSFSLLDLDKTYCVARNQTKLKELYLIGAFESAVYSSLDIRIYQCNNATSQVPCASQEVLEKYLVGGWFNVYYINTLINPKNYENPNSRFQDVYYTMITPSSYKNTEIDLGHVYVTTDSGWILETAHTESYTKINKITEFIQLEPHPDKVLMLCTFQMSKLENYFLRSYKKIQKILAEVGGLANAIFVIFIFITTPYIKLKFHQALMNELFDIKPLVKSKNKRKKNKDYLKSKDQIAEIYKSCESHKINFQKLQKQSSPDFKLDFFSEDLILNTLHIKNATSIGGEQTQRVELDSQRIKLKIGMNDLSPLNSPKAISFRTSKDTNREILQTSSESKRKKPCSLTRLSHSKTYSMRNTRTEAVEKDLKHKNSKENSTKNALLSNKEYPFKLKRKVLEESESETPEHFSFLSEQGVDVLKQRRNSRDMIIKEIAKRVENKPQKRHKKRSLQDNTQECDPKKENLQIKNVLDEESRENDCVEEHDFIEKILKNAKDNPYKVDLSIWEYISSFFYKPKALRQKLNLMNQGIKNIEERLDIKNILKKLRELDKLTALILNHEQLNLFQNLPKPEIRLPDNNLLLRKNITFAGNFLRKANFLDGSAPESKIIESYKMIKSKNQKTEIDKRLLQIYSENF